MTDQQKLPEVVQKKEIQNTSGNSPAEIMKMAVLNGADLEKIEKGLELQIRWEENEAKKAYFASLAKCKAELPVIYKDCGVDYNAKGGRVKYDFAKLNKIVDKITETLSKYNLSATWESRNQQNCVEVTCKITHALGHSERTALTGPPDNTGAKNSIQAIGSTVSYLQRYTLELALGIVPQDRDDDGNFGKMPSGNQTPQPLSPEPPKNNDGLISTAQAKRLYAISKASGLEDDFVKDHLKQKYGINSSKEIRLECYEEIVEWAKSFGGK